MIALALVRYDQRQKIIDPPRGVPDAFEATCVICTNRKPYAGHEVTHWEGPAPNPSGFIEHPEFI
jgi:hypothetical protein